MSIYLYMRRKFQCFFKLRVINSLHQYRWREFKHMKAFWKRAAALVLSVLVLISGQIFANAEETDSGKSQIETVYFDSVTVGKQQRMQVYLPAGYEGGNSNYPTLYLINGGGTDDTAWTSGGNMQEIMDELIADEAAVPMIVVMPDGGLNDPSEKATGTGRKEGQDGKRFGGQNETGAAIQAVPRPLTWIRQKQSMTDATFSLRNLKPISSQ